MSEDNQYIFTHEKGGVSRLITELFLFIIPQFIAIAVVSSYAQYFTSSSQPTSYAPQIVFLLLFAALTLGLINLAKSSYSSVVYKLLFFFAIIQGLRIVAGMSFHGIALWILILLLIILYFANYTILYHNLLLAIALPGIGALLASYLSLQSAFFIVACLVIYDYIAVTKTKHMIGMFHKMMHQEVYFAYIIPPNLRHWGDSISFISDHRVQYMFLGTGDIIMPMLILTHTFFISKVMTLWILAGASLALVGMYLILVKSKYQKALPALPFIALGMLTGFLVHLLLS